MKKLFKKFVSSVGKRALCALMFAVLLCGTSAASVSFGLSAEPNGEESASGYALHVSGGQVKSENTYYDVSFSFTKDGYFSNLIPAPGNITMEYTGVEMSREAVPGQVMGVGRGKDLSNASTLTHDATGNANGAFGFHFNGGNSSFTPAGQNGKLIYDVTTHSATYNGAAVNNNAYVYPNDFATADGNGSAHFGVQWLGGTYSAMLTDMKVYDADGWDLGVSISSNADSQSSQLKGIAGKTVTVRGANLGLGREAAGIVFTDDKGESADIDFTDNGDGTYSFTMPSYALHVEVMTKPAGMYGITLTNAQAKTDKIVHDVSFSYTKDGYFSNLLPASGNITMEYTGVESSRTSDVGHVMGISRGTGLSNQATLSNAEDGTPNGAFGFHFNGGGTSFTPGGQDGKLIYDVSTHTATYNGAAVNNNALIYSNDFAQADSNGAVHFGVQWLAGTYSATLTNMKVYDADGWDLGVYCSRWSDSEDPTPSVQKYAKADEQIVVRPILPDGAVLSHWKINGEKAADQVFTDNGDGTYSFTMPREKAEIEAVYVESIALGGEYKTAFIEGNPFEYEGMIVTASYSDGSVAAVTGYSVDKSGELSLSDNDTEITVMYLGKVAKYRITIVEKSLVSIEIVTPPTKTSYIEGEDISLSGMTVKAVYDNGDVDNDFKDYTVDLSKAPAFSAGSSATVTVNAGTVSDTFDITVTEKQLTGIAVTTAPTKTEYIEGQELDVTGMVVTATYDNGESKTTTAYTLDKTVLALGDTTVTVTSTEKPSVTATFAVTVVEKSLASIEIVTSPTKTSYIEGEDIDLSGMTVKAVYDNGDVDNDFKDYTVDLSKAPAFSAGSSATVTVSAGTVSDTFDITVAEKTLLRIEIDTLPTKTEYKAGETFDPAGLVVKAIYDNGEKAEISGCTFDKTELKKEDTTVTVTFGGKSAEIKISVKAGGCGSVTVGTGCLFALLTVLTAALLVKKKRKTEI